MCSKKKTLGCCSATEFKVLQLGLGFRVLYYTQNMKTHHIMGL